MARMTTVITSVASNLTPRETTGCWLVISHQIESKLMWTALMLKHICRKKTVDVWQNGKRKMLLKLNWIFALLNALWWKRTIAFPLTENDEDTTHNADDPDEMNVILDDCEGNGSGSGSGSSGSNGSDGSNRSSDSGKNRRTSLAKKMTSNLRRLSNAADLKIDMSDAPPATTKYCNKKIKVNIHKLTLFQWWFLIRFSALQRHSIHGMMEEENVIRPHQEIQALSFEEKKYLLAVERGDVAGTRRFVYPIRSARR